MMKRIIVGLLCSTSSLTLNAQGIHGTYKSVAVADAGSREITFTKPSFTEKTNGHLVGKKGAGKFFVKNNTLTLIYEQIKNADTSRYEIQSDINETEIGNIEVKVLDDAGMPMQAYIGLRDNVNAPIGLSFTNEKGIGHLILFKHKILGYFMIDAIGYERVLIPANKLLGKNSVITAYLKQQTTFRIEPHKEVYTIVKNANRELILSTNNKKNIIKMIRTE